MTTRVQVEGTTADLPTRAFSLAGPFVRAPSPISNGRWAPGQENWLFFSVGTAAPAGEPHYEIKTTTDSLSSLQILPAQTGWVELRVARNGELFTLLHKPEGAEDWEVVEQLIRPDLPYVLNVGVTAYADWPTLLAGYPDFNAYNTQGAPENNADMIARIDYIDLRRPSVGRLPIFNIDAPDLNEAITTRRAELFADVTEGM
ncbi:MAG: hypothetical protein AAFR68_10180 [Pseudomonadota bacterium]